MSFVPHTWVVVDLREVVVGDFVKLSNPPIGQVFSTRSLRTEEGVEIVEVQLNTAAWRDLSGVSADPATAIVGFPFQAIEVWRER